MGAKMTSQSTVCARLWRGLSVSRSGKVSPCCAYSESVIDLTNESGQQILASNALAELREKSLNGVELPGCSRCFEKERSGGSSMRQIYNKAYEIETTHRAEDKLKSANEDVLLRSITITVGNLCNLKCRMCGPYSSSRIAADPIHSAWYGKLKSIHDGRGIEDSYAKMLDGCDTLTHLQISGGEPLIIPGVHNILQRLVESGRAREIIVMMPTNCTGVKPKVLDLLSKFKEAHLRISMDGYGRGNEYIRFPSKWSEVVKTINVIRKLENSKLSIGFTLSALNVFEISKTALFGDELGIPFTFGIVHSPSYLSPRVLPKTTLEHAAATVDCAAKGVVASSTRRELIAVSGLLRSFPSEERKLKDWSEFVAFTNQLDLSRSQSFEAWLPDLAASICMVEGPWPNGPKRSGNAPACV